MRPRNLLENRHSVALSPAPDREPCPVERGTNSAAFPELSGNIFENIYLVAASELGIRYQRAPGKHGGWLLGNTQTVFLKGSVLAINDKSLRKRTRNKALTQNLLGENGIPVPEFVYQYVGASWHQCFARFLAFAKSRFPVVVKPNFGQQAFGVYTDIRSAEELARVLVLLGEREVRSLILERHIKGDTFRGIVFDGRLIDLVRWDLSTIAGDGQSTVRELLNALNATDPEYREIPQSDRLLEILSKHQLNLDSVPEAGQQIKLVDAGIFRGARRQRVPLDSVPNETRELLARIGPLTGARIVGVDFVCEDITMQVPDQEFGINEVNSSPGFGLFYAGSSEHDLEVVKLILSDVC